MAYAASRAASLAAIESGLVRLKWLAAAARLQLAMRRHDLALKAGFDPSQPRVPAGNPDGGQWTRVVGGVSPGSTERPVLPDATPDDLWIPGARPSQISRRIVHRTELNSCSLAPDGNCAARRAER
jgi:hypothetical protein